MLAILRLVFAALLALGGPAFAVTVEDLQGQFTLDKTPQRIVVLELSFADALAAVDLSPVGIADDNDPARILPEVRARLKPWRSVVTVLHDLNQASRYCDHLVVLESGKVRAQGLPEQVLTPTLLGSVFQLEAEIHPDPISRRPMCVMK